MTDLGAAVAMLDGVAGIQGVVRFLQLSEERCLIDGTIDGLEPGPHGIHVHTLGDLTLDCLRWDHPDLTLLHHFGDRRLQSFCMFCQIMSCRSRLFQLWGALQPVWKTTRWPRGLRKGTV